MTSTPQNPRYGCRKPTTNTKYDCKYNNTAKAFNSSKYSVLSIPPFSKIDNTGFTQFRRLSWYCKKKYITRWQGLTLIKKKWLAAIKHGGKIWVAEICPDEIKEYLRTSSKCKT
jgi:hypothetical protein